MFFVRAHFLTLKSPHENHLPLLRELEGTALQSLTKQSSTVGKNGLWFLLFSPNRLLVNALFSPDV
jgi:hypothetical protein